MVQQQQALRKKKDEKVGPVLMAQVDEKLVAASYARLVGGNAKTPAEQVKALNDNAANIPADNQMQCDVCKGYSHEDEDKCPFCGDDGTDGEADEPVKAEAPKAHANGKANGGAKTKKHDSTPPSDMEEEAEGTPSAAESEAKAGSNAGGLMLSGAGIPSPAVATEAKLNAAVSNVLELKGRGAASMWDIGQAITRIFDAQLWKQRKDEKEKPVFKTFEAFCQKELGFSRASAYWLMDVAKAFTRDTVLAYGTTKLGLILQAPAEERERIHARVIGGATANEVRQLVKGAKAKAGTKPKLTERQEKAGRTKPTTGAVGRPPSPEKITAISMFGSGTVKMFKQQAKDAKPVRAMRVSHNPHGEHVFENGVVMRLFIVTNAAGELAVKYKLSRDEK